MKLPIHTLELPPSSTIQNLLQHLEKEYHLPAQHCYVFLKCSFMANPFDSLGDLCQTFGVKNQEKKELNLTLAEQHAWGWFLINS